MKHLKQSKLGLIDY